MSTCQSFGSQTDYDLDDLLLRGWMVTFVRVSNGGVYEVRVEAERHGSKIWGEDKDISKALSQVRRTIQETFP